MDDPLGCLFWLLWLPVRLWEWTSDNSHLGRSPNDQKTILFWRRFAIVGAAILVAAAAAAGLWFKWDVF